MNQPKESNINCYFINTSKLDKEELDYFKIELVEPGTHWLKHTLVMELNLANIRYEIELDNTSY